MRDSDNRRFRQQFDEAVGTDDVSSRIAQLRSLLKELDGLSAPDADLFELNAVVKAELCRHGEYDLEDAADAVQMADRAGRHGWPNFYLAEAAMRHDDLKLALLSVDRVPEDFFESRDLMWRSVRLSEIEAVANLKLGNLERAEQLINEIANNMVSHGDSDDLASPVTLVDTLLAMVEETHGTSADFARRALSEMLMTVSADDWFSPKRTAAIRSVL